MNKNLITHLTVFLTSFSLLFYQIALTRIFSITKWYNLVSIIITLALLGFSISGTLIAFFKNQIDKYFDQINSISLSLFPLSISLSFIIYLKIPFNPYELVISLIQIFYLFLYSFVIGIPFLIGAFIIGIALYKFDAKTIYGINMCGSGLGALIVVLSLHWYHPFILIPIITIISIASFLISTINLNMRLRLITLLFSITYTTLLLLNFKNLTTDGISQYKPLSRTLLLPNSTIEYVRYSPLSVIQTVAAEGLRSVAGLSLNSPYEVPEQKIIFFDGSGTSAITPYKENSEDIGFLSFTPAALPYELINKEKRNNLLIAGVGGGEGILKGLLYEFKNIDGLEINKKVIQLMRNEYSTFSGDIYNKAGVIIYSEEARGFIRRSKKRYDLIDISMIDGYNSASSGVYAMNETYLYTVEAIEDFYNHLSDNGILSISRWVNIPPKNCIKMMNICINALKKEKIENISEHIIFIRSIQSATFLISKAPFSNDQIRKTKEFCNSRLFDIIYHKDISESDINQFIKLKSPIYFESVQTFLNPKLTKAHDFDISASTDDKPYFYNFFNYNMLKTIISNKHQRPPVIDWGYFILILMLIPISISGVLFLLFPLMFFYPKERISFSEISLFSLLGIGFFFIEMPLIQKFILFLSYPVYSVSIVITALLIFSGIGSLVSDKIFNAQQRVLYCGISILSIISLYSIFFDSFLTYLFTMPFTLKIIVTIIMISPLGFFMGIPFPYALSQIKKLNSHSYPWAWGINGFFSVISIITATILAICFGLSAVLAVAVICYLSAGIIALKLFSCRS